MQGAGPRPLRKMTPLQYRQRYKHVFDLLAEHKGNVKAVAEYLDQTPQNIYKLMRSAKIKRTWGFEKLS